MAGFKGLSCLRVQSSSLWEMSPRGGWAGLCPAGGAPQGSLSLWLGAGILPFPGLRGGLLVPTKVWVFLKIISKFGILSLYEVLSPCDKGTWRKASPSWLGESPCSVWPWPPGGSCH